MKPKEGVILELELTKKEFRRLIDMAYVGNWVLNSMRGNQRFEDYDHVQSLLFAKAKAEGMAELSTVYDGVVYPSRAYMEGGIHAVIAEYESDMFYDVLAEDLARRDMADVEITPFNFQELLDRMNEYLEEFEANGTERIRIDESILELDSVESEELEELDEE